MTSPVQMGVSLQVCADLRCVVMQATLAGNRRWEKSQPFIIFPKSEEEMNIDALRREGKEIQGLMRSLKDASGQYRNLSDRLLPEREGRYGAWRKHTCIMTHTDTRTVCSKWMRTAVNTHDYFHKQAHAHKHTQTHTNTHKHTQTHRKT